MTFPHVTLFPTCYFEVHNGIEEKAITAATLEMGKTRLKICKCCDYSHRASKRLSRTYFSVFHGFSLPMVAATLGSGIFQSYSSGKIIKFLGLETPGQRELGGFWGMGFLALAKTSRL